MELVRSRVGEQRSGTYRSGGQGHQLVALEGGLPRVCGPRQLLWENEQEGAGGPTLGTNSPLSIKFLNLAPCVFFLVGMAASEE